MNQGHISELIGADNSELLGEFIRQSGIPIVILITDFEGAIAQAENTQIDYEGLANALRHLASEVDLLVQPR